MRQIAKRYGLSTTALHKHKHKMPDTLRKAVLAAALKPAEKDLAKLKAEEGAGLLSDLSMQRVRLLLMQDACIGSEQYGVATQISAQIHRNLTIVGEYLGELVHRSSTTTVSLVLTPEYVSLRTAILSALAPFPAARAAVAAAIQRIERQANQQAPQPVLAPPVVDVTGAPHA
ncbi:hypothetical protein AC629_34980 [Bradyrhizobium sp. NAS80.1]|uniref:hypothetical protein n=1 Tax=Bradyrhizobium sp. NAS80.1 TaxID=1680159 RepID=UPI0009640EB3|nr:hypothetical protein [Bradyrhizobium sp. NAS80.1]OKO74513.1 hypothetical protein AC629_34980 [Bradyrhizobium sp. NAS80.1]